jgi:hypothetical protein
MISTTSSRTFWDLGFPLLQLHFERFDDVFHDVCAIFLRQYGTDLGLFHETSLVGTPGHQPEAAQLICFRLMMS